PKKKRAPAKKPAAEKKAPAKKRAVKKKVSITVRFIISLSPVPTPTHQDESEASGEDFA
ncbi:hypothetical protein HYDPIDRAFT_131021, partial [Hydnomerulius pinastri MD-312]